MIKRRFFLQNAALSAFASAVVPLSTHANQGNANDQHTIVRQPEEFESILVRENTPITFHLSKTKDGLETVSVCSEHIQPGGAIPTHKHIHHDEYFYFIAGTGAIIANDVDSSVKPGTTAFVPRDTWHSIKNTGTEPLFFLFGFTPAGFEDFFRQIGTPVGKPFQQKPKDEFDAIAKKFGMVFK